MHRLLYRDGLTLEQARRRHRRTAGGPSRRRGPTCADAGLPGRAARAASSAETPGGTRAAPGLRPAWHGGRRGLGRPAGRPAAGGLRQRWPDLQPRASAGPHMARGASRPGGRSERWPCAATSRCCATTASSRHPRSARRRLLADGRRPSSASTRPDFNLGLEARLEGRRHPDRALRLPVDLGLARRRARKIKAQRGPCAVPVPVRAALLQRSTACGHLRRPSAGRRDPAGAAARPPRAGAGPGRRRDRWWPAARQPGSRSVHRAAFPAGRGAACSAAAGLRFVLPVAPACGRWSSRWCAHAPGPAGCRSAHGQSHEALAACDVTLIASGTATLEAALFKRPMVIAYNMHWLSWQLMKRMRLQPWVGLPNILCREFVVPELLQDDATPAGAGRSGAGWLDAPPAAAPATAFCRAAPGTAARHGAPGHRCDREILARLNRSPGSGTARPGGRGGRGRPRAAGRAGGGGRRDPGRPATRSRPGRLQEAQSPRGARRCSTRSAPRRSAAAHCRGQRGGDRPLNILQATLLAMQRAVEGCA
jgi:lipid-A-disaccharide synthase